MNKAIITKEITAIICGGVILSGLCISVNAENTAVDTSKEKTQISAAAKLCECTEKEAEAIITSIRPEMRGAFLSGKMRLQSKSKTKVEISAVQTGKPANKVSVSRQKIIATMKNINKQAKSESWPLTKAGAMRREYARRHVGTELTIEELKRWVANPNLIPAL
jgi:hypothetical protein